MRQRFVERNVHRYGAIHNGRIDSHDMPRDHPVVRIHRRRQAKLDIFRLCFSNLQLSLEMLRLDHFRQRSSRRDPLPNFQRLLLQDAGDSCAHVQLCKLRLLQTRQRSKLFHRRLFGV